MTSRHHDPLTFAGTDEEDLEDLTSQLEQAALQPTPRHDSFDLGDAGDLQGSTSFNPFTGQHEHDKSIDAIASYGQLVRPPTYQESVYHPAAAQPASSSPLSAARSPGSDAPSPSPAAAAAASEGLVGPPGVEQLLRARITDPIKRDQSIFGGHVEYLVTTTTQLPSYSQQPPPKVRRRFSDFVSLAEALKFRYRGYFIPPRPEKNAVEGKRMGDAFVEERRVALQKWLDKLGRHPVLARGEELRTFLTLEGELTGSPQWCALLPAPAGLAEGTSRLTAQLLGRERPVVDPVSAARATTKKGDIMRAIKESRQNQKPAVYSEEELALRTKKGQMEELREALMTAARVAEQLVNKMDRSGTALGDLGLALFKLGKLAEVEGAPLAAYTGTVRHNTAIADDAKRSATALVRLSKLARKVTGKSAIELSTCHEYLGMMPAVIKGLRNREKQLLTQHTLEADLEAKQRSVAELEEAGSKVFGGDRNKIKKVQNIKSDISQLELSIAAAKTQYGKIMDINNQELRRFDSERRSEFLQMLQNYAITQVAAAERSVELWQQLAVELGATPSQQVGFNRQPPASSISTGDVAL